MERVIEKEGYGEGKRNGGKEREPERERVTEKAIERGGGGVGSGKKEDGYTIENHSRVR